MENLKIKNKEVIENKHYLILEDDSVLLVTKEEFYINKIDHYPRLETDIVELGLGYKHN